MSEKAEPRFDLDLKYGQEGERRIAELFQCLATNDPRVEVKRKTIIDHKIYIETAHDKGRTGRYTPSGISVTTAAMWVVVIGDTGIHIGIPTDLLRVAILERSAVDKEERDGSCPTRGKLIDFCMLLLYLRNRAARGEIVPPPTPIAKATASALKDLTADDIRW